MGRVVILRWKSMFGLRAETSIVGVCLMYLSTKGRYAMVALSDIALQPAEGLVSLGDISARQDISLPYLEQLFV